MYTNTIEQINSVLIQSEESQAHNNSGKSTKQIKNPKYFNSRKDSYTHPSIFISCSHNQT